MEADRLIERLIRLRKEAQDTLVRFRERLQAEPVQALYEAGKVLSAAAKAQEMDFVLEFLREGGTAKKAREWLQIVVQEGVRNPGRSSSPMSNLMTQEILAAQAWLLDALEDVLED